MNRYPFRWVVVAVAASFVFSPADIDAKLFAVAATLAIAGIGAMIGLLLPGRKPVQTRRVVIASVLERATFVLPPESRIDWDRPLLVAGKQPSGVTWVGLLLKRQESEDSDVVFYAQLIVDRGRIPQSCTFATRLAVKQWLISSGLHVVQQSDFADEAVVELYGKEWRDPW